jgi:hypothetical protein
MSAKENHPLVLNILIELDNGRDLVAEVVQLVAKGLEIT